MKQPIKIFKMVNGDFVIGKLSADEWIIDAVQLTIQPNGSSGIGIGLMPMMFPFDSEMTGHHIKCNKSMLEMNAPSEVESQYITATTGILTANKLPDDIKKSGLTLIK